MRIDDQRTQELSQELQDAQDEGRKCQVTPRILRQLLAAAAIEAIAVRGHEIETARANRAEKFNAQLFEQLSELRLEIADLREAHERRASAVATMEGG